MTASDWPLVRLKDLGTWFGGGTPPKSSPGFWTDGTVPWLSPKDMGPEVLAGTQDHITADAVQNSSVKRVPAGSVALVVRSGILERTLPVALVPFGTTLNQDMKAVVARRDIDARWIAWGLRASEHELLRTCRKTGTTVASMEMPRLYEHTIPVPPLEEQMRIVEILEDHLSRLDAAIGGLHLARARAAVLERSVIDDVFMRRADEANWRVVRLEELAATERRSMTDGPFGSNLTSAHYTVSGARVVRLQNIGDGKYRAADAFISLDHYDTLRSHDVRAGDVVVASLGDLLPRAAVVPDLAGPAIVKADCIRIRPQAGIDPAWIVLACRSSRAKRWAEERVHGVGRQRLGMKGIRDIPVPFPDPTTRNVAIAEIASGFESLHRLRDAIDSARSHGGVLRKSLLAAAFSGCLTGHSTDMEMVEEMAGV